MRTRFEVWNCNLDEPLVVSFWNKRWTYLFGLQYCAKAQAKATKVHQAEIALPKKYTNKNMTIQGWDLAPSCAANKWSLSYLTHSHSGKKGDRYNFLLPVNQNYHFTGIFQKFLFDGLDQYQIFILLDNFRFYHVFLFQYVGSNQNKLLKD